MGELESLNTAHLSSKQGQGGVAYPIPFWFLCAPADSWIPAHALLHLQAGVMCFFCCSAPGWNHLSVL